MSASPRKSRLRRVLRRYGHPRLRHLSGEGGPAARGFRSPRVAQSEPAAHGRSISEGLRNAEDMPTRASRLGGPGRTSGTGRLRKSTPRYAPRRELLEANGSLGASGTMVPRSAYESLPPRRAGRTSGTGRPEGRRPLDTLPGGSNSGRTGRRGPRCSAGPFG
jgi:hypothetical protein